MLNTPLALCSTARTVALATSSHDEWLEAVRAGIGVSICPDITARYYPRPGVRFIPVPDMEPAPFYVAWLREHAQPLVLDFVDCAVAVAGAAVP